MVLLLQTGVSEMVEISRCTQCGRMSRELWDGCCRRCFKGLIVDYDDEPERVEREPERCPHCGQRLPE